MTYQRSDHVCSELPQMKYCTVDVHKLLPLYLLQTVIYGNERSCPTTSTSVDIKHHIHQIVVSSVLKEKHYTSLYIFTSSNVEELLTYINNYM